MQYTAKIPISEYCLLYTNYCVCGTVETLLRKKNLPQK